MNTHKICIIGILLHISFTAGAALHDRGNGLIYDDVLDITWSQDANPAGTQGLGIVWPSFGDDLGDVLGYMTFSDARSWIDEMNQSRYKGYNDWRLPSVSPLNGDYFVMGNQITGCNGLICDYGYNIGAPDTNYSGSTASELAYMFHTNLGNYSLELPSGATNTTSCHSEKPYCLANTSHFYNLSPDRYWTETLANPPLVSGSHPNYFVYSMKLGRQEYRPENTYALVWPVRDGDIVSNTVPPHPVPSFQWWALVLLNIGSALIAAKAEQKA